MNTLEVLLMWVGTSQYIINPTSFTLKDCSHRPPARLVIQDSSQEIGEYFQGRSQLLFLAENENLVVVSPEETCKDSSSLDSGHEATLPEIIRKLRAQVEGEAIPTCNIIVRREHVMTDVLKAAKRRSFKPHGKPVVEFVGEDGIDTGELKRELWRLFSQSVSQSLFYGPPEARTVIHSVQRLQSGDFCKLGQITAMSIVHEGPGMPFITKTIFDYISGVDICQVSVSPRAIPIPDIAAFAVEMGEASDTEFADILKREEVLEILVDAGCHSLQQKDKQSVLRMLCLHHCLLVIKAELDQLCEGLCTLGVLDEIKRNPQFFAQFFLSEGSEDLTADYVRSLFEQKSFSKKGTTDGEKRKLHTCSS
jgi:hypothetical protein